MTVDRLEQQAVYLAGWLREQLRQAGGRGFVFGLSGGIDSALVAALSKRAEPNRLLGVVMPCHSDPKDQVDAQLVANTLGIPTRTVDLSPIFDALLTAVSEQMEGEPSELARANLKPRLRMTTLYAFANQLNYLVVGTGNRSELAVGYYTKYGDGGADVLPLGRLVKSQVRKLSRHLGVPERIIERPPSAGLWAGQTDETEMGLTYDELDRYLLTGEAAPEARERIERMASQSEHKRHLPPLPDAFPAS